MSPANIRLPAALSPEGAEVSALYQSLLDAWNRRDARAFAALFEEQGQAVGFDGSQMSGPDELSRELTRIFADHVTGAYVGIVRAVRLLGPAVALLRAVAGLLPPGKTDLNPTTNAIQTLVAVRHAGQWRIAHYQNTPAQFHGRPDLAEQLTEELRQLL